MGNRWAALGGAVLIAAIALVMWRLGTTGSGAHPQDPAADDVRDEVPQAEPSATAATSAPPTSPPATPQPEDTRTESSPAASPTRTASPTEVALPTPSPREPPADAPPLIGSAQVDDVTGDLVDSAGLPPSVPQPAADLTGVGLTGDGDEVAVEFSLAGQVPASAGSLVWSLDLWLGGTLAYTVTVQQVGTRVVGGVLDWGSGVQVRPPEPPVVDGATVSVTVPGALLGQVDGPFRWQAVGQADGGYEDYVPEDGTLAWFPQQVP